MWDLTLYYGQFAIWHNWTPDQVDALPDFYRARLEQYHQMLDEMAHEERARQDRVSRARERASGRG